MNKNPLIPEFGTLQMDEIPDTKPEIDIVTGGVSSERIRRQSEEEEKVILTPESADKPDFDDVQDNDSEIKRKKRSI